jgi:hypothetical protein
MPYLLFSGTSGVFGCSAPFWVQWFYPRYINEDFAYNYNGASLVSGFIGPEVTPYINVTDSYDSNGGVVSDTTVASATSLTFGFAGMHAFPLTRHASFMLRTGNTGIRFKDDMSGSIEYGKATTAFRFLFTSDTRASVTFPCIRNINRGRLYADNLYATPFYELHFVGTDRYFADPVHEAFTQKTFDSDAVAVSHWIGLGMELGTIKNYAFARPLRFEAAWDALDNDFKCDVSFGF